MSLTPVAPRSASFFPESTLTRAGAMGVSTVVSSSSRSRMAS